MITTTTTLEADLAQHLAGLGLAQYTPTGTYSATTLVPAVFFGRIPDKPDSALAINIYDDHRDVDDQSPTVSVQLRFRGGKDPRTVNHQADAVFAAIHDLSSQVWGATTVLLCRRHVRAPIGADSNGRYERADSYRLTLNPAR